jgi:hypothetical protein
VVVARVTSFHDLKIGKTTPHASTSLVARFSYMPYTLHMMPGTELALMKTE